MANDIKLYWTTKDGKKIDVDKMDIDHLRNVVKLIIRKMEEKMNRDIDFKQRCEEFEADING